MVIVPYSYTKSHTASIWITCLLAGITIWHVRGGNINRWKREVEDKKQSDLGHFMKQVWFKVEHLVLVSKRDRLFGYLDKFNYNKDHWQTTADGILSKNWNKWGVILKIGWLLLMLASVALRAAARPPMPQHNSPRRAHPLFLEFPDLSPHCNAYQYWNFSGI